jgi:hypothetical protein
MVQMAIWCVGFVCGVAEGTDGNMVRGLCVWVTEGTDGNMVCGLFVLDNLGYRVQYGA